MEIWDQIRRARTAPPNVLHGTDWWRDADDVAALRILCRAHQAGTARLLGVGVNAVMEQTAASVSAFLSKEGVNVPVGLDFDAVYDPAGCRYQNLLARYPHTICANGDCPDAVALYRRLLWDADGETIITETGFPTVLAGLLKSPADRICPLSGAELLKKKVRAIYLVGGRWDVPDGDEYNFTAYPRNREAASVLLRDCPVPLIFLGFETGFGVISCRKLPDGDLLREALAVNGKSDGIYSWDPLLVTLALFGDAEKAGFALVRGQADADARTGCCNFRKLPTGPHAYVVKTRPNPYYESLLEDLLR